MACLSACPPARLRRLGSFVSLTVICLSVRAQDKTLMDSLTEFLGCALNAVAVVAVIVLRMWVLLLGACGFACLL